MKLQQFEKKFLKSEMYNYKTNKKLLEELESELKVDNFKIETRTFIILAERVEKVEKVLSQLSKEDAENAELIFFKGHTQIYAEVNDYISKQTYYSTINRILLMLAKEYNLI